MARQRAIKLYHNRTFEEKNFKSERNKLKDGKDTCVFEPLSVFAEKKGKALKVIPRFWRASRHIILFIDGATEALKFGETTEDMKPFETQSDVRKLVVREMKKSLREHKPMKWSQFILLMIPILAICVMLLNLTFGGRF